MQGERLDSWKEISCFLGCSIRTAQRWERLHGLPVRRPRIGNQVYALVPDLQRWQEKIFGYALPPGSDPHIPSFQNQSEEVGQ